MRHDFVVDDRGLSEKVRQLIFERIDSVEEVEVLLALKSVAPQALTADELVRELRSSLTSVDQRLKSLQRSGLIESENLAYLYAPKTQKLKEAVSELEVEYRQRRQKILALIFSPAKRARSLADAFKFGGNGGESDA